MTASKKDVILNAIVGCFAKLFAIPLSTRGEVAGGEGP